MAMLTSPIPISRIVGLTRNYGRGAGRYIAGNALSAGIGAGAGAIAGGVLDSDNRLGGAAMGAAGVGAASAVATGALGRVGLAGLEKGGLKKAGGGMLKFLGRLGR